MSRAAGIRRRHCTDRHGHTDEEVFHAQEITDKEDSTMKMKSKRTFLSVTLSLICLFAFTAADVRAEEGGFKLKSGATVRDILTDQVGKRVAVRIDSGEEIEGTVTNVGDGLVQISRLTGRDFFDAVVRIDRISSVRMRVRDR
jgi:hypothetical protein